MEWEESKISGASPGRLTMPTQSRLFGFRVGDIADIGFGYFGSREVIGIQNIPDKTYDEIILLGKHRFSSVLSTTVQPEINLVPPDDWRERVKDGWKIVVPMPEYHGEECGFDLGASIIDDIAVRVRRVINAARVVITDYRDHYFAGPLDQWNAVRELERAMGALDGIAAKPAEEKKDGQA